MAQIVTANRLANGLVVFRTEDGWSEDVADAARSEDTQGAERLVAAAAADVAACLIVDPYLIDLDDAAGKAGPKLRREFIRATGPTVQTSLNGARHGGDV